MFSSVITNESSNAITAAHITAERIIQVLTSELFPIPARPLHQRTLSSHFAIYDIKNFSVSMHVLGIHAGLGSSCFLGFSS